MGTHRAVNRLLTDTRNTCPACFDQGRNQMSYILLAGILFSGLTAIGYLLQEPKTSKIQ